MPPGSDRARNRRNFYQATLAPCTHGFYVNEADDENAARYDSHHQRNFPRLLEIKRRCDPDNNFRLNANISAQS